MYDDFDHITDEELIEKYRLSGEMPLLGIVFRRYTLMALAVCMKYLKDKSAAQDVSQQAFLKAIQYLSTHKVSYFKSWFYMVLKNESLMYLRSQRSHQINDEEEQSLLEELVDTPSDALVREQKLVLLEQSIAELKADQRICVEMFYLKKCSYQEISDYLEVDIARVRSYIQNGKRNLKILFNEKNC